MENNFYTIFKRIIRKCNYDNTYKMAWAKALVEISLEIEEDKYLVDIDLKTIAPKYIKYYWNQTIYFDLIQGSNLLKTPVILQKIKQLIEEYYKYIENRKPVRFERIEYFIKENLQDEYKKLLKI